MIPMKRVAGALGVAAGVALIAFTGPAAMADGATSTLVSADKPANPGSQGNGHGNAGNGGQADQTQDQTQTQDPTQAQDTTKDQTKDQTRAQLRDEIRANGASWGAYQRQGALIKVASKLAERYGATPENTNAASLGRILTLINSGLPAGLQIDVEMFLAQYELSLSASPSVTPSVSPTA